MVAILGKNNVSVHSQEGCCYNQVRQGPSVAVTDLNRYDAVMVQTTTIVVQRNVSFLIFSDMWSYRLRSARVVVSTCTSHNRFPALDV